MRVTVDDALCTGHGRCYALAPDVFGPDDYGHCLVVASDGGAGVVAARFEDQARVGRDSCPERAIAITD